MHTSVASFSNGNTSMMRNLVLPTSTGIRCKSKFHSLPLALELTFAIHPALKSREKQKNMLTAGRSLLYHQVKEICANTGNYFDEFAQN